jgi:Ca2+-binding EF-hand superfamily protein
MKISDVKQIFMQFDKDMNGTLEIHELETMFR